MGKEYRCGDTIYVEENVTEKESCSECNGTGFSSVDDNGIRHMCSKCMGSGYEKVFSKKAKNAYKIISIERSLFSGDSKYLIVRVGGKRKKTKVIKEDKIVGRRSR